MDIEPSTPPPLSNILCPIHSSPIIFICDRHDCSFRHFLCAKCVNQELVHITTHSPLTLWEELPLQFVDTSFFPFSAIEKEGMRAEVESCLNALQIAAEKQRGSVEEAINRVKKAFEHKIEEWGQKVSQMGEKKVQKLANAFEKLEKERQTEGRETAKLRGWEDVRKESALKGKDEEKLQFLKEEIDRRQKWQMASSEMKSFQKDYCGFLEEKVKKIMEDKLEVVGRDELEREGMEAGKKVIEKIAKILGEEDDEEDDGFVFLKVSDMNEFSLLTPQMVTQNTMIVYTPKQEPNSSLIETFKKLTFLRHFRLQADPFSCDVPLTYQHLKSIFDALKPIPLISLDLSLPNSNLDDLELEAIFKSLPLFPLRRLSLDFAHNPFHSLPSLPVLPFLSSLHLTLPPSSQSLSSLLPLIQDLPLKDLKLNLSGFSLAHIILPSSSLILLRKTISSLKNLTKLDLDLGYCGVEDSGIEDLAKGVKKLDGLKFLGLGLNNNRIGIKGAKKLGKKIRKLGLKEVRVNLHSNRVEEEGSKILVEEIGKRGKGMVNLRNNGMEREEARRVWEIVKGKKLKILL